MYISLGTNDLNVHGFKFDTVAGNNFLSVFCSVVAELDLIMDEIAPEYDVVVLGTGTHTAHCFTLPHYILTLLQG